MNDGDEVNADEVHKTLRYPWLPSVPLGEPPTLRLRTTIPSSVPECFPSSKGIQRTSPFWPECLLNMQHLEGTMTMAPFV